MIGIWQSIRLTQFYHDLIRMDQEEAIGALAKLEDDAFFMGRTGTRPEPKTVFYPNPWCQPHGRGAPFMSTDHKPVEEVGPIGSPKCICGCMRYDHRLGICLGPVPNVPCPKDCRKFKAAKQPAAPPKALTLARELMRIPQTSAESIARALVASGLFPAESEPYECDHKFGHRYIDLNGRWHCPECKEVVKGP